MEKSRTGKWKVTAIIFIVLTITLTIITLVLLGISYTTYDAMYDNLCNAECAGLTYHYSEIIDIEGIGESCVCFNPDLIGIPLIAGIDENHLVYNLEGKFGIESPSEKAFLAFMPNPEIYQIFKDAAEYCYNSQLL